jgi:hypothetical protein
MLIAVYFLDHVHNASEPIEFVVYGRLAKFTDEYLVIDSWHYTDAEQGYDENVERFVILRAVVRKITRLKETK